jgi:hypothetical protein
LRDVRGAVGTQGDHGRVVMVGEALRLTLIEGERHGPILPPFPAVTAIPTMVASVHGTSSDPVIDPLLVRQLAPKTLTGCRYDS